MTQTLRLVHCSDIHLDADSRLFPPGKAPRDQFARALDEMTALSPDMMLLAGDLFDSNRALPETIEWSMEALAALPYPVFMIPGNHDCMAEDGIFRRYDFNGIENLSFIADEAGEIAWDDTLGVAVWGKGMAAHTPDYRPVSDCPARPHGCRWYFGMGHGLFVDDGEATDRSSPIARRDVAESPFDYLALGHHHAAMEIVTDTTLAAYCGSPTDDIGRGPTFAVVDMEQGVGPTLEIVTLR